MNNGHCFRSFSFSHDMCGGVVSSIEHEQHYYTVMILKMCLFHVHKLCMYRLCSKQW